MEKKLYIALILLLILFATASLLIVDMQLDDKNDHSKAITQATFAFQLINTIVILVLLLLTISSKVKAFVGRYRYGVVLQAVVDELRGILSPLTIIGLLYAFGVQVAYLDKYIGEYSGASDERKAIIYFNIFQLVVLGLVLVIGLLVIPLITRKQSKIEVI